MAFTYHGLEALGVPQTSLDSFAPEFREGMEARAGLLGDVGESSPEHWEAPFGSADVHVAIAVLAPDAARLEEAAEKAAGTHRAAGSGGGLASGLLPARHRTDLVRFQGRHRPARGRRKRRPSTSPREPPLKAGEIILGYPDETGELPPMPTPEVLGRNGTYVVLRKLHTKVATYRRYLRDRAANREEEDLLGAKMVGRWQSGAPLAVVPDHDDPDSVPMPGATTTSASATTPAASSARWVPTPGGPTRETPSTGKAVSTSVCTG